MAAVMMMMMLPAYECRLCLERFKAAGCLSPVMTPDCINGACPFALSSAAPGPASRANTSRVSGTTAEDVVGRAMEAARSLHLLPCGSWLLYGTASFDAGDLKSLWAPTPAHCCCSLVQVLRAPFCVFFPVSDLALFPSFFSFVGGGHL